MHKEVNLSFYQPDFMKEVKEFKNIAETENIQFLFLWEKLKKSFDYQFIESISESGVCIWEKMLSIIPKSTDELEDRRFRIILKLNENIPYTIRTLMTMLDLLCGYDGYTLELKNDIYKFVVRIALKNKSRFKDIQDMLRRVVPVNLLLDLSLLYNRHFEVGRYRNKFLAEYTHEQIREREILLFTENNEFMYKKYKMLESYKHDMLRNKN